VRRSAAWAALLATGALIGGCSYAAPLDRSRVESAVPLSDGSVAVAFRQLRYRPATGLAAYPDGGVPRYLDDGEIVGVLRPDGSARVLWRLRNPGVHGSLAVSLRAAAADPEHLLALASWQPPGSGASTSSWSRLGWRGGGREPLPDLAALLRAQGRSFGSPEFGDVRVLDDKGSLLIGAQAAGVGEIWLYQPGAGLRLVAPIKHFYGVAGDELYYWSGDEAVLRNWRTGATRLVARYDPATRVTTRHLRDDPALRTLDQPAPTGPQVEIAPDGRSVRVRLAAGQAELRPPADWWPR